MRPCRKTGPFFCRNTSKFVYLILIRRSFDAGPSSTGESVMTKPAPDQVHSAVREHYGAIARSKQSSDACCSSGCCDSLYPASQVADLPASVTDLSLGCGDPVTVADIRPGDTVIDLGAGGGID